MDSKAPHKTLQPGEMLNWYRIERILGRGGFGVIYLATDTNLDHQVAVKEYLPSDITTRTADNTVQPKQLSQSDMFRWGMDRFIKEARNLVKFKHPNIVRVMSVFQANNTAYMVMEFEEGLDLRSALRQPGGNDEQALKRLILPISKGLAEVHRHGFIHRDIKPANILVRRDGSPVLIDFGSARNATKFTQQSLTALVSVGYAPLEQYNDESEEQQGPWTDIYALGGTLYYAISGRDPVESTRRATALFNGGKDPLISAEKLGEGRFSPGFLKAIDWAMQFRIADRPQSLSDWMPALLAEDPRSEADRDNFDVHLLDDLTDATVLSRQRPQRNASMNAAPSREVFSKRGDAQNSSVLAAELSAELVAAETNNNVAEKAIASSERGGWFKGLGGLSLFALLLSAGAVWIWFASDQTPDATNVNVTPEKVLEAAQTSAKIDPENTGPASDSDKAQNTAQDTVQTMPQSAANHLDNSNITNQGELAAAEQTNADAAQAVAQQKIQQAREKALAEAEALRLANEKAALEAAAAQAQARAQANALAEQEAKQVQAKAEQEAKALAATAEKERQEKEASRLAALKATQDQERATALAASEARAARTERRLKQAILASQSSLSVGDLSAAQRQLDIAKTIAAEDARVETLAFAVNRAVEAQNKPVSDAEFDLVARMFDGLRRAIENKDAQAMDRLAINSNETALFKALMQRFERLDVSIVGIRVRNADKSISGTLRIDSMVRENGDRATPSDAYQSRIIKSKRVNGGWSKIEW